LLAKSLRLGSLTEILGTLPCPASALAAVSAIPDRSISVRPFPDQHAPSSRTGRVGMATEKCIEEFDADDVIFEEDWFEEDWPYRNAARSCGLTNAVRDCSTAATRKDHFEGEAHEIL
jgi:hypothetical protein